MKKLLFALAIALGAAGCKAGVSGVTCETDQDCTTQGDKCVNNVCVGGGSNGTSSTTGTASASTSSSSGSTGTTSSTSGSTGSGSSSGSSGTTGAACPSGCSNPSDYCDTSVPGGQCKPAYAITFDSPTADGWYDAGGAPVTVEVTIAPDSGFEQPAQVLIAQGACSDAGAALTYVAGTTWDGGWTPNVTNDGQVAICAQAEWPDGGVVASNSVTVRVDVTPPTVSLALGTPPHTTVDPAVTDGGYFRDDAPVPVAMTATDPAGGFGGATVNITGSAQGSTQSLPDGGLQIDLQSLPLAAANGWYELSVSATDGVGNTSPPQTVGFWVTRWKWVADTTSGAPIFTPAVQSGSIYAAAAAGSNDNIFKIDSIDGTIAWHKKVPSNPGLAPAIEPSGAKLFVVNGSNVSLVELSDGSDGGGQNGLDSKLNALGLGAIPDPEDGGPAWTAFMTTGNKKVFAVQDAVLIPGQLNEFDTGLTPLPDITKGVIVLGDSIEVGYGSSTSTSSLDRYVTSRATSGVVSMSKQSSLSVSRPILIGPVGDRDAVFFAGGTLGANTISFVDLDAGAERVAPASLVDMSQAVAPEPVMDVAGNVFFAVGSSLVMREAVLNGVWASSVSEQVDGSGGLLLGKNNLYAITSDGKINVDPLAAFGQSSGSSIYTIDISAAGTANAPPALVCGNRGESLLIVPTSSGTIIAVVIDDSGFDPSAIWPKARRDQFNSANVTVPISACP